MAEFASTLWKLYSLFKIDWQNRIVRSNFICKKHAVVNLNNTMMTHRAYENIKFTTILRKGVVKITSKKQELYIPKTHTVLPFQTNWKYIQEQQGSRTFLESGLHVKSHEYVYQCLKKQPFNWCREQSVNSITTPSSTDIISAMWNSVRVIAFKGVWNKKIGHRRRKQCKQYNMNNTNNTTWTIQTIQTIQTCEIHA